MGLRGLGVLRADDYEALMEALPAELRGIASRLWVGLGFPAPRPVLTNGDGKASKDTSH